MLQYSWAPNRSTSHFADRTLEFRTAHVWLSRLATWLFNSIGTVAASMDQRYLPLLVHADTPQMPNKCVERRNSAHGAETRPSRTRSWAAAFQRSAAFELRLPDQERCCMSLRDVASIPTTAEKRTLRRTTGFGVAAYAKREKRRDGGSRMGVTPTGKQSFRVCSDVTKREGWWVWLERKPFPLGTRAARLHADAGRSCERMAGGGAGLPEVAAAIPVMFAMNGAGASFKTGVRPNKCVERRNSAHGAETRPTRTRSWAAAFQRSAAFELRLPEKERCCMSLRDEASKPTTVADGRGTARRGWHCCVGRREKRRGGGNRLV